MFFNEYLKTIPFIDIIKEASGDCQLYLVGGSVRDIILKRQTADYDMVVFGTDYESFAFKLAKKMKAAAIKFKDNVRIAKKGIEFDISAPRGQNILEDLQKRDFTINNLALSMSGELVGDSSDINKRIIRMVHKDIFNDDPLRVLRTYRFASQLGFEIDSLTAETALIFAPRLKSIASERIFAELQKLAKGRDSLKFMSKLVEDGILNIIANTSKDEEAMLAKALKEMEAENLFIKMSAFIFGFRDNPLKQMETMTFPAKISKLVATTAKAFETLKSIDCSDVENFEEYVYNFRIEKYMAADMFYSIYGQKDKLLNNIKNADSKMDFSKERIVNGEVLKQLGVPDGKVMGTIIKEVSFKLVSGKLENLEDAKIYIKQHYKEHINEAFEI